MKDAGQVLSERASTHGDFAQNAHYSQEMKQLFREAHENLSIVQREALDMIAAKICRILSGNANEPDHWLDIEGYARLARQRLEDVEKKSTCDGFGE
jgi:hypothetical protein